MITLSAFSFLSLCCVIGIQAATILYLILTKNTPRAS